MHLVQPILILWSLRRYGRIFWMVLVYDIAMTISVLLLEQHYVVGLLMASPVAMLSLPAVDWEQLKQFLNRSEHALDVSGVVRQ